MLDDPPVGFNLFPGVLSSAAEHSIVYMTGHMAAKHKSPKLGFAKNQQFSMNKLLNLQHN